MRGVATVFSWACAMPEARRCGGLSIAATIRQYELRDQNDPEKFCAWITRADLDEVSLTPAPCNSQCTVTSRFPASPQAEFYDLAERGVTTLLKLVDLIREEIRKQPDPPPAQPARQVIQTSLEHPAQRRTPSAAYPV
jgi:hypothetical protein